MKIITMVVIFFSSYSLFSNPIVESTPYLNSDTFSIFSYHYQRIYWSIIFAFITAICESQHIYPGSLIYGVNLGTLIA
jgi:hypothetical protein